MSIFTSTARFGDVQQDIGDSAMRFTYLLNASFETSLDWRHRSLQWTYVTPEFAALTKGDFGRFNPRFTDITC